MAIERNGLGGDCLVGIREEVLISKLSNVNKDGCTFGNIQKYNQGTSGKYLKFISPKGWDFTNFNPLVYGNGTHSSEVSENLSLAGWGASGVAITGNASLAPNGELTASKLAFTANTQYANLNTTILSKSDGSNFETTSLQGKTYTFSAWIWSANKTQICLRICGKTTGTDQTYTIFNLSTTPTRVSVTRTFTSTDTGFTIAFENRSGLGFGDGGSGDLYAWGVKIDEGATALPYYSPCNGFLAFSGDSLTDSSYPTTVMTNYGGFFHVQDSYKFATAGHKMADIIGNWSTVNAATSKANKFLVVWGGTNDIMAGYDVSLTHAAFHQYCKTARAAGWKVIVLTMIARGDVDVETKRTEYNNMIRSNYHMYADALVDVGVDSRFSTPPSGATEIYNADKAHLTAAGYSAIADMVKAVLDKKIVFYY